VLVWAIIMMASLSTLLARLMSPAPVIDNSVGIWFMKDDPELKVYEDFNRQFDQTEWSILLLEADSIFEPTFLRDLAQLTSRLEQVKHVTKVVSLTNVRDSEATADGMLAYRVLYPAQSKSETISSAEVEEFRRRLYANPIFEGGILKRSTDKSTVVLFKNDNFIRAPEPYRIELMDAVRHVLAGYPRVRAYSIAGTSVINAELNRSSQHDGIVFYVLVSVFIVIAGYVSLRSWRDLMVVLAVVTASALPPMAALAALRIPFNMVTVMLPPILITLSVCDVVHVINAFHSERRRLDPEPAIVKAIAGIWWPCMWTSVVTAAGFVSLAFSTVYPIWQMGVFAAVGIALAWLTTMSCVPVFLVRLWPKGRTGESRAADGSKPTGLYAKRLLPLQAGGWRWAWLGAAAIMVVSIYGIRRVEVDTNYTKFFGSDTYVTRAYPELSKAGYGQNPISVMLRFPQGTTYASAGNIERILRFEEGLRKDPTVIKLLTLTDLLARADLAFNGPEDASGRLATYNPQQISQLYLLAEAGGNDDLRDFLTEDKRTVQEIAMAPYLSSKELEAFKARMHDLGATTLPVDAEVKVTGTTVQWANMDREISQTQMSSVYIITVVFLVLLPLVFRSLVLGTIGVLINSLPLAITFGCMGLLDIKINLATALIGGVAIGATVDSTIFFINRVRLELADGKAWAEAVDQAVATVGDGIIMTSVILAGGFSCLATSSFLPTSNFGGLVSFSIVVALFMDILINPIVLRLVGPWAFRAAVDARRVESAVG
jgi:predicted RND superfamily exporter protein